MEIRVEREISFRLAVHGRLLIDGDRVCDTLENGATCMKPGSYPLVRSYSLFSAANGIHRLGEKIAVGEWQYLGFLVRTQPVRGSFSPTSVSCAIAKCPSSSSSARRGCSDCNIPEEPWRFPFSTALLCYISLLSDDIIAGILSILLLFLCFISEEVMNAQSCCYNEADCDEKTI